MGVSGLVFWYQGSGFLRSSWASSGRVPKIRGTLLGVPLIRTLVSWGLHLGSPYFGKLPFKEGLLGLGFRVMIFSAF